MMELFERVGRDIVVPLEQGKQLLLIESEGEEDLLATTMLDYAL
jgi:uncharacterized protein (UPF0218 family)